jgi:large subunit ribosomal protein L21
MMRFAYIPARIPLCDAGRFVFCLYYTPVATPNGTGNAVKTGPGGSFACRRMCHWQDRQIGNIAMYALVKTGGKQYRVAKDDTILVERIAADEGAQVILDDVVMLGDGDKVTIGTPTVAGAAVSATVMRQTRGPKIIIFRRKRRKNHRRTQGHRQDLTLLRITDIAEDAKKLAKPAAPKPAASKKAAAPKKAAAKKAEAKAATKKAAPKAAAPKKAAAKKTAAKKAAAKK